MGCGASNASKTLEQSNVPALPPLSNNSENTQASATDKRASSCPLSDTNNFQSALVVEGMHIEVCKFKTSACNIITHEKDVDNDFADPDSEDSGRSTDYVSDLDIDELEGSLKINSEDSLAGSLSGKNPRRLIVENITDSQISRLRDNLRTLVSIDELELSACQVIGFQMPIVVCLFCPLLCVI